VKIQIFKRFRIKKMLGLGWRLLIVVVGIVIVTLAKLWPYAQVVAMAVGAVGIVLGTVVWVAVGGVESMLPQRISYPAASLWTAWQNAIVAYGTAAGFPSEFYNASSFAGGAGGIESCVVTFEGSSNVDVWSGNQPGPTTFQSLSAAAKSAFAIPSAATITQTTSQGGVTVQGNGPVAVKYGGMPYTQLVQMPAAMINAIGSLYPGKGNWSAYTMFAYNGRVYMFVSGPQGSGSPPSLTFQSGYTVTTSAPTSAGILPDVYYVLPGVNVGGWPTPFNIQQQVKTNGQTFMMLPPPPSS